MGECGVRGRPQRGSLRAPSLLVGVRTVTQSPALCPAARPLPACLNVLSDARRALCAPCRARAAAASLLQYSAPASVNSDLSPTHCVKYATVTCVNPVMRSLLTNQRPPVSTVSAVGYGALIFSRPYWVVRSRYGTMFSPSVVCLSVCNVLYCG